MDEDIEDYDCNRPLTRSERCLEWFVANFRGPLLLVPYLLISLASKSAWSIRCFVMSRFGSAPRAHTRKLEVIRKELEEWDEEGRRKKLVNARPGWKQMSFRFPIYKDNAHLVSTHSLYDILNLDLEAMTVKVEPGVTMGQLTSFLIPQGYTLPVVPELDDLTVGGLINGCGVESSSFKHGLFADFCVSYEVIYHDGLVETVNEKTQNRGTSPGQLFYTIPWSLGTLCFLTAATIRIVPCKKYVKLTYEKVSSVQEMTEKMTALTTAEAKLGPIEFIEGLLYSQSEGVLMTGVLSDGPGHQGETINSIGRYYKEWFYEYVHKLIKRSNRTVEYIPLRDYYHRHTRSIFWEIKDILPFGNNPVFRYLFGWSCPPPISLLKLTTPKVLRRLYDRKHVIQDMLVPLSDLEETIDKFHEEVEIYPIWLCPFEITREYGMVRTKSDGRKLYIDVGIYGVSELEHYKPKTTTRRLEEFVRSKGGYQMQYADIYMTREEYDKMFDMSNYNYLRAKFQVEDIFPHVYDKVCRTNRR